jgi:hypothetical protein
MKTPVHVVPAVIAALFVGACGSKQPEKTTPTKDVDTEGAKDTEKEAEKEKAVQEAKKEIQHWISEDVAKKFTATGLAHGKVLGDKLARNDAILDEAKALSKDVLKGKKIKPRLKEIEDKATAGFGKKLTLGWKALKAGGIDEFKKKVSEDAKRVAMEVLTEHLKNDVLKDPRAGELFKAASPVLKVQGRIAAIALQENISPKVAQKIMSIALRIAAAGDNTEIAGRVQNWITTCEVEMNAKIDKAMAEVSALKSLQDALTGIASEVLSHPRTKKELSTMINALLDDKQIYEGLIKVYEAAAFEKGDPAIAEAMKVVIELEIFDKQLFETLTRLAEAKGAGVIIGKHLKTVGEDPALATIVEDFILSVLDTCGDPADN